MLSSSYWHFHFWGLPSPKQNHFLYLFKISREMNSGGLSTVFHVQEDTSKSCLVLIVIHHSHLWKAMGLQAWGKKNTANHIFSTNYTSLAHFIWIYEQACQGTEWGSRLHDYQGLFLIHLSYSLPLTESQYKETKSWSMGSKTMESIT